MYYTWGLFLFSSNNDGTGADCKADRGPAVVGSEMNSIF